MSKNYQHRQHQPARQEAQQPAEQRNPFDVPGDRRSFLKLAGSGLMVAAAPAVALAEPVRRFWQVGRNAPLRGRYDPFRETLDGVDLKDLVERPDSVTLYPVDRPPVKCVADHRIPKGRRLPQNRHARAYPIQWHVVSR